MASTFSERLFEEYLVNKALVRDKDFFYEPDLGKSKKPDYHLVKELNALFEIKAFTNSKEMVGQLRESRTFSFQRNPYSQVRKKIEAARKKFKDFKDEYTCALVLHKGDSITIALEPDLVASALFGDLSLPISPDGQNGKWFFGRNGVLSPKKNRTLSAVIIIEEEFPDRRKSADEFYKLHQIPKETTMQQLEEKYLNWCRTKGYDLSKRAVLLKAVINPFTTKRFPVDFFNPTDQVFAFDDAGHFGRLVV